MERRRFEYQRCEGGLIVDPPLSESVVQQLVQPANEFELDGLILDTSGLDAEWDMARDYVAFFRFLLRFADIVKDPDGLVQGFLAKESEDPAWDTYSIRGGKLYCQREEVFREAPQEVTEISEQDKALPISVVIYEGYLRFPDLTGEKQKEIEAFLRQQRGYPDQIEDQKFEITRCGKDLERHYLQFLLNLIRACSDITVEGEFVAHGDLMTGPYQPFFEFYHVQQGKLFQQKGVIRKQPEVEIQIPPAD